ncbi:uncharacterized protein LOC108595572 [Drosophila busckii]|uniref:uncharacterized protein LOC108595572 n=1 Tax=Drosophila busckii TaxID=30019 RepID=UPI001433126E|nr:uncharacterized protein LOC108595572 [Drosophila busckii]
MRCFILLTLLLVVLMALSVNAGSVTIKGQCVDCNKPETTSTTRKPKGGRTTTTVKPKHRSAAKSSDESDEDTSLGDISLDMDSHGHQHIGHRHKRQWGRQIIRTDNNFGNSGYPGYVTTIDGRGQYEPVVRNNDCVGCNIRA